MKQGFVVLLIFIFLLILSFRAVRYQLYWDGNELLILILFVLATIGLELDKGIGHVDNEGKRFSFSRVLYPISVSIVVIFIILILLGLYLFFFGDWGPM